MGRRRRVAVAAAVVLLPVAAVYTWIDVAAPRDRIVNRGRVWKCDLLGGTWTIDFGDFAGVQPGLYLDRFGSVQDIVVADIFTTDGRRVGRGAWTTEHAAVDAGARRVSSRHSRLTAKGRSFEIRAARECADRGIF